MNLGQEIKTVLVTGGTGFAGGAVAQRLRSLGCAVRALVRQGSATTALASGGCELHYGDITDSASVRAAMDGVDAAVHCAALASDWGPCATFVAVNTEGSRHVFDAAMACGVKRLVHFSTTDVFGIYDDGRVIDDSFPYQQTGFPYSDTKAEAERIALAYAQERGLPVTVIRPTFIYGPGDRTFFPELVDAMRKHEIAFIGSSHNTIPLCYIDNLVDAVLLALTSDRAVGQAYIVCDGPTVTWHELTDMLALQLDLPRVKLTVPLPAAKAAAVGAETWGHVTKSANRPALTRYELAFAGHDLRYSNAKICHELGFAPQIMPGEGLARTIAWLKSLDLAALKTK